MSMIMKDVPIDTEIDTRSMRWNWSVHREKVADQWNCFGWGRWGPDPIKVGHTRELRSREENE